jgi:hypothetical protein
MEPTRARLVALVRATVPLLSFALGILAEETGRRW